MTSLQVPTTALPTGIDLDALYDEQLPKVVERARRSPYYRYRLPCGPTPFQALPVTTKQDLRDAYPFGLLAVDRADLATYHESSGTAGNPTPSYYTERDWVDLAERYARKWVGIGPDDTMLVRTPYALMVTGHLAQAAARSRGAMVVPGDNRSLAMPCSRVLRVLHDLKVTLTWSMPTETLMWAAAAHHHGLDPQHDFPALRALFVGGEPVTEAKRRRMSDLWGVPVVEEYGSTETGSLAGQCPEGRMHLWADRVLFEVRNPDTGLICRDGVGQLVVTPLFREAMPLVRYDLADKVEVSHDLCPCGCTLPTVRVLGRSAMSYDVRGVAIRQTDVERIVYSLPMNLGVLFWRGRASQDGLHLQIETHEPAAASALSDAVTAELGCSVEVERLPVGGLVSPDLLLAVSDVTKPRSLFGPDEAWDKALIYY